MRHHFSLTAGFMREEVRETLIAQSSAVIPENIHGMIELTESPFIQAITDLEVPAMHFDRSLILGDAAFVVRPHTAGGTAKAAGDATALACGG